MKYVNYVALALVIIGALNWGLIGFFGYDLITGIFGGDMFWIARVIFALVGLAGLCSLAFFPCVGNEHRRMGTHSEK